MAFKAALGLTNYTSNKKLMSLGVSNSFAGIREALLISQKQRLQKTKAGRAILLTVGSPAVVHSIIDQVDMSTEIQTRLKLFPQLETCTPTCTKIEE
ncbi:hypothetical protein HPB48_015287 [Haemaphysalis longicornis]|uniref:Uncharacterized protein n=1 Tax=Haemaphysalis longicornis TaxID=44386 RepID=A0A9J6GJC9_HAELO|nr:hypothetical protein HPB48_015287 [Haemaphysalis longicornis]